MRLPQTATGIMRVEHKPLALAANIMLNPGGREILTNFATQYGIRTHKSGTPTMPTDNYCFHTELNSLLSIGGFFRSSRAGWPTCCSLDYVYSIAEKLNFVNMFEEKIFRKMGRFVRWWTPNTDGRFYANLPQILYFSPYSFLSSTNVNSFSGNSIVCGRRKQRNLSLGTYIKPFIFFMTSRASFSMEYALSFSTETAERMRT